MAKKIRSPNYPAINLEMAAKLARKLYETSPRHPMPLSTVAADVWGYKPGSYVDQCVAALRQFGLAKITGVGAQRQIQITADAAKLAEDHPERAEILRRGALAPKVHQNIWEKYGPFSEETTPQDSTLRHYLLFEHSPSFNTKAVEGFINEFRQTIEYAGVGLQDHISQNNGHENGNGNGNGNGDGQGEDDLPPPVPPRRYKMKQDTFTLSEGDVVLRWPDQLTEASAKYLESWLKLMLMKIKDAASLPPNDDLKDEG